MMINFKPKCIIFSRVSTSTQSLESQNAILYQHAHKEGYDDSEIKLIEQTESAVLNDIDNRIGIQQLFRMIEETPSIKCVIVFEISRIGRRPDVLYKVRDYLLERKIQLICIKPEIRLLDENGNFSQSANLIFSIFSSLAESEGFIRKERFARAKNLLKHQGKKFSGATVFGYIKNKDKKCVPHPVNSKIIVDIYNHYINCDSSLYETYKYISGKYPDLFPMMDYVKCQHKIRHILDKPVYYKGDWCYQPLVTEEMWQRVHEKMSEAIAKPRYKCKREFLCRGKIVCGHCGNIMSGAGGNMLAYICTRDKQHNMQVNWGAMDWLIWEETRVAVNINSTFEDSKKKSELIEKIKTKENLKNGYKKQIEEIEEKQEKLLSLYLENKIHKNIFENKNNELESSREHHRADFEKVCAEIESLQNVLEESQKELLSPRSINVDSITDFESRLELVRKYISKMIVTKDKENDRVKHIEFEYAFPVIIPKSKYRYEALNQFKKIYRINEDGTEDLIYNEGKINNRNKNGSFTKKDLGTGVKPRSD